MMDMQETCCQVYTEEGAPIPTMEDVLWNGEYAMYTGDVQLDAFVYCLLFHCGAEYCAGIGL